MLCPKCGHERTDKDDPLIPDYQCPACSIIYAKYKPPGESSEIANSVIANIRKSRQQMKPAVFVADESPRLNANEDDIKTPSSHPDKPSKINRQTLILLAFVIPLATYTGLNSYQNYLDERQKAHEEEQRRQAQAELDRQRQIQINAANARKARQRQLDEQAAKANERERQLAQKKAACKESAECTFNDIPGYPQVECQRRLERNAKYRFKWTDEGWFARKFDRVIWQDNTKTVVIAGGDHLQLENGFGAWSNYQYACYVRVSDGAILNIQAAPGRF